MNKEYFNSEQEYDFSDSDEALVSNFKIDHPDAYQITTKEQILKLVNYSSNYRKWYLEWKELRSSYSERPEFLGDSPEDLSEWRNLDAARQDLKIISRKWQTEINVKSKELRATIDKIQKQKEEKYRTLDPILVINMLNVNNLPDDDLLEIAVEKDETKVDELIREKVLSMQKRLYKEYKETGEFNHPILGKED